MLYDIDSINKLQRLVSFKAKDLHIHLRCNRSLIRTIAPCIVDFDTFGKVGIHLATKNRVIHPHKQEDADINVFIDHRGYIVPDPQHVEATEDSVQDYYKILCSLDWHHMYTDDHNVWKKAEREFKQAKFIAGRVPWRRAMFNDYSHLVQIKSTQTLDLTKYLKMENVHE